MQSPYIIEHPTRGLLRIDSVPGNAEWHWSRTANRNEFEKIWSTLQLTRAKEVFNLLPDSARQHAAVRQFQPGIRWPSDSYPIIWDETKRKVEAAKVR